MSSKDPSVPDWVDEILRRAADRSDLLLWLTGAGISAESGIPTFRGADGYWRVGSKNYHPQEMATRAAFDRMPDEVWSWYLYRRSRCRAANPNPAHNALAQLERTTERFLLVTQNVDGLHLRAGNSPGRTYEIHGNLDFLRCSSDCSSEVLPIPVALSLPWEKDRKLDKSEQTVLRCKHCGAWTRPHVLWFDECYDEEHFRFESAVNAVSQADVLFVVGTTGATTLPAHMMEIALRRHTPIVVIDVEEHPLARMSPNGGFLQGPAGEWVPRITERMTALL